MTELSNAVTVLIARMESHPEDFDMSAADAPRFGYLAPYLTKIAGGGDELAFKHEGSYVEEPFWFLSDADKQALADAWKQYHYKCFEKRTMEKIFDNDYYERQEEKKRQMMLYKQQMHQSQLAASTGTFGGGQITAIPNPAQNAALGHSNNTGLFGSAGSAIQGLFK